MKNDIFDNKISTLNGVAEKKEKLYNKLGVYTLRDLLELYPRKYIDYSNQISLNDAENGEEVTIKATLLEKLLPFRISGGRTLYEAICESADLRFRVTYFNNRYALMYAKPGEELIFRGKINKNNNPYQMVGPTFILSNALEKITPIYSQTAGLTTYAIAKDVKTVYNMIKNNLEDEIPENIRMKYGISHKRFAIHNIHFPISLEDYEIAKYRLMFEELLITQLALRKMKTGNKVKTNIILKDVNIQEFYDNLPFKLTNAQKRIINECISDLSTGLAMNRLIQGDVGSGKTVVAAAVVFALYKKGFQSAIMVPTEILANQHLNTFKNFLSHFGVKVGMLTGKMKAKEKKIMLSAIKNGEIDLVVGTHALISRGVEFQNLSLVVTDEQHRFGVKQRSNLITKGNNPHTIIMSATPIPRTLSLILYGDLDISLIDEMPPGRQKVKTFLVRSSMHERIMNFIKKHVDSGNQVYIVCSRVEEGEESDGLKSVVEYGNELMKKDLKNYSVEILHGQMKSKEKDEIMNRFYQNITKILVTTTVVEVGIDVKKASIMMVQNSERFGLSQLHQLRGRVGRGKDESFCILFSDTKNELTLERLKIMVEKNDGFQLAEEDLRLRGPGDFFGDRQHGLPSFKIADLLNNQDVLKKADECANSILKEDKNLISEKYKKINESVERLYKKFGEVALN